MGEKQYTKYRLNIWFKKRWREKRKYFFWLFQVSKEFNKVIMSQQPELRVDMVKIHSDVKERL